MPCDERQPAQLTSEEARMVIKAIEEVEREEALHQEKETTEDALD